MPEKKIKTRIQHKHDVAANWDNAVNFIPLAGELIIYDPDESHTYPRFKVGDGVVVDGITVGTRVYDLPFVISGAQVQMVTWEADD